MFKCKYYAIICSTTLPLALIIERSERELRKESLREWERNIDKREKEQEENKS